MKTRRHNDEEKGFALFMVVMMVALLSIAGMALMDVVRIDLLIVGNGRQEAVAKEIAEGALMEMINDSQTPDQLPMLDDSDLTQTYTPSNQSAFLEVAHNRRFNADARLLRIVPLSESSHTYTRAVVHEVRVASDVAGEASFELSAEVFRTATFRPGRVLPRRHAR